MSARIIPLAAATAGLLMATGALAQKTYPPHVDMPIGAQLGAVQPANNDGTTIATTAVPELLEKVSPQVLEQYGLTAQTPATAEVAARVPDTAESATTVVVTNGPVFDTAENRRLYRPLSRAGRATSAAGN